MKRIAFLILMSLGGCQLGSIDTKSRDYVLGSGDLGEVGLWATRQDDYAKRVDAAVVLSQVALQQRPEFGPDDARAAEEALLSVLASIAGGPDDEEVDFAGGKQSRAQVLRRSLVGIDTAVATASPIMARRRDAIALARRLASGTLDKDWADKLLQDYVRELEEMAHRLANPGPDEDPLMGRNRGTD